MPSSSPGITLTQVAWKGVARKLFRNLALAIAVSLLVSLLVFALLFKQAVEEDLEAATRKLGADLVLVPPQAIGIAEEFILESKHKTFYMESSVFDQVKDLPEIEASTYQIYLSRLESGCCSIEEGQVIAFDPTTDFVVKSWMQDPPPLGKNEVYIGNYIYEFLGLIQTAKLFGTGVKIVAHLDKTNTGVDRGIFMRIEDLAGISDEARGAYRPGTISIVFLKVKEGILPEAVATKIRSINPRIGIMTRGSIGGGVRATLKDIVRIFSITIFISSLLAVLLAWSTFTAMTNERRREVGILRAIGARQGQIVRLFLTEAAMISVLGGVIGIVIGHYLIRHLAANFNLLSRLDAAATISMNNLGVSLIGIGIGIGVCLTGALAPVLRLARLEPLLAIKDE